MLLRIVVFYTGVSTRTLLQYEIIHCLKVCLMHGMTQTLSSILSSPEKQDLISTRLRNVACHIPSLLSADRLPHTLDTGLKINRENEQCPGHHMLRRSSFMPVSGDFQTEFLLPILRSSLTDVFKSLANGMITRVRQLGWSAQNDIPSAEFGPGGGIGAANGTAFIVETQIHVRWACIVLPCLLLILTMDFLGIIIFETRKKGLEAWKSSPTALVCSGLDEDAQQEIRAARDPVKMEDLATDIPVRLRRCEADTPGGYWKLETSAQS